MIGGARLTFWGTGHLGFEVTGGYAPAKVGGETVNEANTNLLLANARVVTDEADAGMLRIEPAE